MATQDVQISDLTQVNTPATTDLLLIRHGTVDSKITYSDIKSAINTNTLYASSDGVVTDQANQYYNRSQVDAKVTNLQNQIDTLNSNNIQNNAIILDNTKDLNNFKDQNCCGFYYCKTNVVNAPTSWMWLLVINGVGTVQIGFTQNRIYIRAYTGNPLAWTNWVSIVLA